LAVFKNIWLPDLGSKAILLSHEYVVVVARPKSFQNKYRRSHCISGHFLNVYKINCTVHGNVATTYEKSNCNIDLLITFQKEFINEYAIFLTADKDLVGWPKWNRFGGQNRRLTAKVYNQ
jgi:hypothetical protein